MSELLSTIEKDCKEHGITIFYGSVDESTYSPIHKLSNEGASWRAYLDVLRRLDCRVIAVTVDINDIGEYDDAIRALDQGIKEQYAGEISLVKKNAGKPLEVTVRFFHAFLQFEFSRKAEWHDDYWTVFHLLDDDRGLDSDEEDDEEADQKFNEYIPKKELPSEEIERIARLVVSKPLYQKARNNAERRRSLDLVEEFGQVMSWADRSTIMSRAEEIFQLEIFPKQEEELKRKIVELRQQGLTKGQIQARLNITVNMLNRHL